MKNKKIIEIGAICLSAVALIVAVVLFALSSDKNSAGNSSTGNTGQSGNNNAFNEGHYYDELFKEEVMEIKITMSEDDVFLMTETPSEDNYYYSDISINGIEWKNVAIRVRGKKNTEAVYEQGSDKYSYKLDFNKFDKKNEFYKLDGLNLDNMIEDPSYIGQYISYKLAEELGAVVPFYTLAKVQINDGPAQWYIATEEMNNSFAKRVTGDDGTVVLFDAANEDALLSSSDVPSNYDVEYGDDGMPSYMEKLIKVLNDPKSTEKDIEAVLNVESVLKVLAVNYVVGNYAGYQGPDPDNFCLLYDNGIISYIEKDYAGAGGNYRKDTGYSLKVSQSKPLYDTADEERPLVTVLLGIEKYKKLYDGYVTTLFDHIETSSLLEDAKKLLGDYTSTEEFKAGEVQLYKYLKRY